MNDLICECGHSMYEHCLDGDHCYWDYNDGEVGGACCQCTCSTCRPVTRFYYLTAVDYVRFIDNEIILYDWHFDSYRDEESCYSREDISLIKEEVIHHCDCDDDCNCKRFYVKVTQEQKDEIIQKSISNAMSICDLDDSYIDCVVSIKNQHMMVLKKLDLKNNKYIIIYGGGRAKTFKTKQDILRDLYSCLAIDNVDVYSIVPFKQLEVVIDIKD